MNEVYSWPISDAMVTKVPFLVVMIAIDFHWCIQYATNLENLGKSKNRDPICVCYHMFHQSVHQPL